MAAKIYNTNRLVQRVSVFVTDFVRKTYGFLTPDYVTELRSFRNEIEDNYQACPLVTKPWNDQKKRAPDTDSEIETETDLDLPPPKKRPK